MNRRQCINCQKAWPSLPLDQLEQQPTCPVCGDVLISVEREEAATAAPDLARPLAQG